MIYDAAIALYWIYLVVLVGVLHNLGTSESARFVRYRAKVMALNPQWWALLVIWAVLATLGWAYCLFGLYALTAMCFLEGFVWFVAFLNGLVVFRKQYEADVKAKQELRIQAMAANVDRNHLAVDALLAGPPERLRH